MPPSDTNLGRLAENITHFVHALRRAGVGIGTTQIHSALESVVAAGFTRRDDFYVVLRATLITRPEHFETFHQVFRLFWRTPDYIERLMEVMLPALQTIAPDRGPPKAAERRAEEAFDPGTDRQSQSQEHQKLEMDARISWSDTEVIRAKDFEQMTSEELRLASQEIRKLTLPVPPIATRRLIRSHRGARPDMRAMLRRALRRGGEIDRLALRKPGKRPPNLVVLCDVSGSMATYSRMMMHFLHGLTWTTNSGWAKVHVFTFGTRLTNISRALSQKDPDLALEALGREVSDWDGGTRIGAALRDFNLHWSRRVLGQGSVVLLITDGLERGNVGILAREAERLSLSCRQLAWLNPLLRWDEFQAKAGGIRALMPHVDSFRTCHSLDSIADLAKALSSPGVKQPLR